MVKQKTLTGVAHDIAHHAGSGLSYLSPHLAQALRKASLETTIIELLDEHPYPQGVEDVSPLRMALESLHATALDILKKYGFELSAVSSIKLHATPAPWDASGYSLHTRTLITALSGQQFASDWLQ